MLSRWLQVVIAVTAAARGCRRRVAARVTLAELCGAERSGHPSSVTGRVALRRPVSTPMGFAHLAEGARPGLAERPEIQDDEGNDPGQENRHHREQDARDDLPRTRTCPRSQPPDERRHDSDKQSVATASVWADERQDTDERPCRESHSLRSARSWCAPGHRREGFYLRPFYLRPCAPGRGQGLPGDRPCCCG